MSDLPGARLLVPGGGRPVFYRQRPVRERNLEALPVEAVYDRPVRGNSFLARVLELWSMERL
ncbi:hypothetical protein [Lewinella sp. IMCC34191]|uniref:hypothetical protein n=1 Tax=Lewinella sp. IMCC34191 TaxID=2259172 RepID=UPI000E247AFF|nr:hypothetical protein [Lewinella sp. IMCC34191]